MKFIEELKGIIFDFDGTLIDSYTNRDQAHKEASKLLMNYLDEQDDLDQFKISKNILEYESNMSNNRISDRNIWWKEIAQRNFGSPRIPKKVLDNISRIYWEKINDTSFLYPEIKSVLSMLKDKGVLLGLLSDTDVLKGMKMKRIENSGLKEFFDSIVIAGEDTEHLKPNKEPFEKIVDLLGVDPENILNIGDNPAVDILGARKLGIKTIILGESKNQLLKESIKPDYFIKGKNIKILERIILSNLY
jgi:HAD superfamily hydrolase (TIGR01549 family)